MRATTSKARRSNPFGWGAPIRRFVLSVRSRIQFFHGPGNHSVGIDLLKPRINFARKHADAVHGIVVLEKASLSHDEQVAVAADMIPMFFDLLEDLIGRAGEHRAGFN